MCGILGLIHLNGESIDPGSFLHMTRALAHRGPDDSGFLFWSPREESRFAQAVDPAFVHLHPDKTVLDPKAGLDSLQGHAAAFGHRRLSILDVTTAGHQPMGDESGKFWIVHNGEIYNFMDLREELKGLGFRFRTRTDAEVILHGYAEWGEKLWPKLNGMFAFALWDRRARKIFLVRDRFGVKPLYYSSLPGRFLFASEVKALLRAPGFPRGIDWAAFDEYFTFQNIFSDRVLFKGVRMLPAGTALELRLGTGTKKLSAYWYYPPAPEAGIFEKKAAVVELRERFEQAVTRQLVSDVPVGAYLSGGMDSGSIVAVATKRFPELATFISGFAMDGIEGREAKFDERAASETLSRFLGTDHHERVMTPESFPLCLEDLVWHLEDLRVGMSWPNYLIAQLASRTVKVVLAGAGGDELFAGYPWRYLPLLDVKEPEAFTRKLYSSWQRLIPDEEKPSAYGEGIWENVEGSSWEVFNSVFPDGWVEDARRRDPDWTLSACLHFEFRTFLRGLFVVEDRLSMAHGLESRVPFMDNDLVAFSQSLPSRLKMAAPERDIRDEHDFHRSNGGKHLLREAMRSLIPEATRLREKQGFSPPAENWYRSTNREYLRETLLSSRAQGRGYFQKGFVERVLYEHESGRKNHPLLIWSLVCFEIWNQQFLEGEHDGAIRV